MVFGHILTRKGLENMMMTERSRVEKTKVDQEN